MSKSKPNQEQLKAYVKELRQNSTVGEVKIWDNLLKQKKMRGLQFNRQFVVKYYIVDFVCRKAKLIIEIDGPSHRFKGKKDKRREVFLVKNGYAVLRFSEYEARAKWKEVGSKIEQWLDENYFNQSS